MSLFHIIHSSVSYCAHLSALKCIHLKFEIVSLLVQLVLDHMPQETYLVHSTSEKNYSRRFHEEIFVQLNDKSLWVFFSHYVENVNIKAVILPLYTPLCTSAPPEIKFLWFPEA